MADPSKYLESTLKKVFRVKAVFLFTDKELLINSARKSK